MEPLASAALTVFPLESGPVAGRQKVARVARNCLESEEVMAADHDGSAILDCVTAIGINSTIEPIGQVVGSERRRANAPPESPVGESQAAGVTTVTGRAHRLSSKRWVATRSAVGEAARGEATAEGPAGKAQPVNYVPVNRKLASECCATSKADRGNYSRSGLSSV
jgi:hypothetical protein